MPPFVVVDRDPPIAVVRINRPEVRNALNSAVMDELCAALEELDADDTIRAVVLTGDEKAFAAGADISGFVEATPISMLIEDLTTKWERVRRVRTPLIAAVSGYALGGGCELAMVCDIIVASETAQFGQPEVNLGIIPGAGGTQRLTRAAGKYRAMELVLTGRRFSAEEAKEIGLVARIFPKDSWLEDAKALAREIAAKPPLAIRLAIEAIDLVANSTLDAGLEFERKAFYLLFASDDKNEGTRAFVEKRRPEFKGR
jgi:enoyl-CoA hydratase